MASGSCTHVLVHATYLSNNAALADVSDINTQHGPQGRGGGSSTHHGALMSLTAGQADENEAPAGRMVSKARPEQAALAWAGELQHGVHCTWVQCGCSPLRCMYVSPHAHGCIGPCVGWRIVTARASTACTTVRILLHLHHGLVHAL